VIALEARAAVLALVVAGVACGPPRPAIAPTNGAASPAADEAGCGDVVDPLDACAVHDGCPGSPHADSGQTGEDGCPEPGGIPVGMACHGDEQHLRAIAREIRSRPRLTRLTIASSVPGCAGAVRIGLEREGVAHETLEAVTRGAPDPCAPWVYFEIAGWDGRRCGG
jgi:hypothetical protein